MEDFSVIYVKQRKILVLAIIVILILIGYLGYNMLFVVDSNNLIIGAKVIKLQCNSDDVEAINMEDYEKYFRPSKLPVLNTNKDMDDLIDTYSDKTVNEIIIPKENLKSSEETIINYFSLLREAANPDKKKSAGCGSIGNALAPYKITYNFFTDDYKKNNKFSDYEDSFKNILHINLIKIKEIPTDIEHKDNEKYFYEIETIEGTKSNAAHFAYYYGYAYLVKNEDEYNIADITISAETYLCAPYHGWQYDAKSAVEIKYGDWCKLINGSVQVESDNYIKNVYFEGNDGKNYKIEFFILTNDYDIEVGQYVKDESGNWKNVKINPEDCLKN